MDYTCIRFSNCMQCVRCICDVAAIFNDNLKVTTTSDQPPQLDLGDASGSCLWLQHAAHVVDCAADCVFHMTAGCMLAQTNAVICNQSPPHWYSCMALSD